MIDDRSNHIGPVETRKNPDVFLDFGVLLQVVKPRLPRASAEPPPGTVRASRFHLYTAGIASRARSCAGQVFLR